MSNQKKFLDEIATPIIKNLSDFINGEKRKKEIEEISFLLQELNHEILRENKITKNHYKWINIIKEKMKVQKNNEHLENRSSEGEKW